MLSRDLSTSAGAPERPGSRGAAWFGQPSGGLCQHRSTSRAALSSARLANPPTGLGAALASGPRWAWGPHGGRPGRTELEPSRELWPDLGAALGTGADEACSALLGIASTWRAHCQGPSPSSPPRERPPPPCARWTAPPLMTPLSRWHPSPSGRSLRPKGGYGGEATAIAVHLKDSEKGRLCTCDCRYRAHASTHRQPGSRTGQPRASSACTTSERDGLAREQHDLAGENDGTIVRLTLKRQDHEASLP